MKVVRSLLGIVGIVALCQGFAQAADKPAAKKPTEKKSAAKPSAAEADESWTFIQLALMPPDLQLVEPTENIIGLRLQIYGSNKNSTSLDVGLINQTTGRFGGLGIGLVNTTGAEGNGLLFAGVNKCKQTASGIHFGLFNLTGKMNGLQVGLVNITEDLNGIQIGLWNQIDSKDLWYILPIVNWKF
jgi:hypothetical protein